MPPPLPRATSAPPNNPPPTRTHARARAGSSLLGASTLGGGYGRAPTRATGCTTTPGATSCPRCARCADRARTRVHAARAAAAAGGEWPRCCCCAAAAGGLALPSTPPMLPLFLSPACTPPRDAAGETPAFIRVTNTKARRCPCCCVLPCVPSAALQPVHTRPCACAPMRAHTHAHSSMRARTHARAGLPLHGGPHELGKAL